VAPLGATLVAVGVGVAVALAKTQLQQRRSHSDRDQPGGGGRGGRAPNPRRPALYRGEPTAEGLRRVVLGQLDLAIELLESHRGAARPATDAPDAEPARREPDAAAARGAEIVHDTRKALKRLRALLRLLRDELGPKRYARENAALRDCGRRLAGARDAEVMLATLDSLVGRDPARLQRSAAVRQLHAQLLAERDTAAIHAIGDPRVRAEVLGELRAVRARAERWQLRERGFKLLAPGLERVYRRGRSDMRVVRRAAKRTTGKRRARAKRRRAIAGQSVTALHVWRKRVKDLRYAAETLDRGGKRYRPVRRIARRADRLGEMLGEEHDLALLEARVRERRRQFAGERKTRERLLKLIAARRRRLRKRALREGQRLYERRPRRFVRRVKRAR
jgi:hypothetical protein